MRFLLLFFLLGLACPFLTAQAAMSSSNYRIDWDTISTGGSDTGSSASYQLRDTIGNMAIGESSSASYDLRAGYRQGIEDQVLTFQLLPQENSTNVSASALASNTVTVSSATDFNAGDYALVIQNEDTDHIVSFGRVVSKTATTLTFDDLVDNGTAPTIDGSDDFVYLLDGSSVSLGNLIRTLVRQTTIGWEVTALSDNGYSIQVFADGDLRDGAKVINPIADGAVTTGNEEYGARSSDTSISGSTFDTQDTAITTSPQPVGTQSTVAFDDRMFLTLKASINSSTNSGNYGQILTFVATGNY